MPWDDPLRKWEDAPMPGCEWSPVPGAVGGGGRGGGRGALLVAVETGWFWWGSGAQAWQLEREPRGSSREGLAPMPMVGVGG